MKTEDQIKALAELDGCKAVVENSQGFNLALKNGDIVTVWKDGTVDGDTEHYLEKLLTSYDAIVPLVCKVLKSSYQDWKNFLDFLHGKEIFDCESLVELLAELFKKTPSQLSEALLRATGKWIEK